MARDGEWPSDEAWDEGPWDRTDSYVKRYRDQNHTSILIHFHFFTRSDNEDVVKSNANKERAQRPEHRHRQ